MAGTDIQHVADAARAALGESAVRVAEPALHFGQVAENSDPHRAVRLLGPPIARACTLEPSQDWIRVDETADGFDVTVDTSVVGARTGSIAITGPTGEAGIAVDVEVAPGTGRRRRPDPQKARSAWSRPIPTSTAPDGPAPRRPDGGAPLRLAGELAVLSAALLIAGLLPGYKGSDSLWDRADYNGTAERYVWYTLTMAPLLLVAGVCVFAPRTRRVTGLGYCWVR